MKHYLHVSSWPSHPMRVEEFNTWYDEVHVPEVVALDGFVGATRLTPVDNDGGPWITIYEIEGDPHEAVERVKAASAAGQLNMSDVLSLGPIPSLRIMAEHLVYTKPGA